MEFFRKTQHPISVALPLRMQLAKSLIICGSTNVIKGAMAKDARNFAAAGYHLGKYFLFQ